MQSRDQKALEEWRRDLADWRENPVTQRLLGLVTALADYERDVALRIMWEQRKADPERIARADRARELAEDLKTATAEHWNEWEDEFERHLAGRL